MKTKDSLICNGKSIDEASLAGLNKSGATGIIDVLDSKTPIDIAYDYGAFFEFPDLNPRNRLKKEFLKWDSINNEDTIIIEHMANHPIFVGIDVDLWKKLKLPMNLQISRKNGTTKTNIIFKGSNISDFNFTNDSVTSYVFVLNSQKVTNCSFNKNFAISTVLDEERLRDWKVNVYKDPSTLNYEVTPMLQAFFEIDGLSGSNISIFKHPKTGTSIFDILYNNSNKFNIYNTSFITTPIIYPRGLKVNDIRTINDKNKEEYERLVYTRPGLGFFKKMDFHFSAQSK